MRITLLAITRVDWKTWMSVLDDLKIEQPRSIDPANHSAFISSLDLNDAPLNALRNNPSVLKHFHCSFAIAGNTQLMVKLSQTDLAIHSQRLDVDYGPQQFLIIASATLAVWKQEVLTYCKPEIHPLLRTCFSLTFFYLRDLGFHSVFDKYDREDQSDGTTIFK